MGLSHTQHQHTHVFMKGKHRLGMVVPMCDLSIRKAEVGAGEMAQWVRALTALPEVLSSNPSNHMVAHNHPQ